MSKYSELKAQIAQLEQQAREVRQTERNEALDKIRELMHTYEITASELQRPAKKASTQRQAVAAKYKDPESGATWTGRGRAPLWLKGRPKDEFLIK